MIFTFLEDVDHVSPQSASFSYNSPARATSRYQVTYGNPNDLLASAEMGIAVKEILGGTRTGGVNFGLTRALPLAHPVFPWLYATDVTEFRGVGKNALNASAAQLEAPAIAPKYWRYAKYYVTVTFQSRPYAVLSDNSAGNVVETVVNYDNTTKHVTAAQEWLRYTDWEPISQPDSVTATQGEMYFRSDALRIPFPGGAFPRYSGMPRMFLNNQLIKFIWYQVPFTYISSTNSYINAFRGKINQLDWFNWSAGELLYLDYRIKRYTPPVPALDQVPNPFAEDPGNKTFSTAKLVDVEFSFLDTVRTTNDTYTPANRNWIVKGHNLLPYWIDRKNFHYATTFNKADGAAPAGSDQTQWYPSWLSVPFSLLFTNPDAAQPEAPLGF